MSLNSCSRLDGKTRSKRIQGGIGVDLRAINREFFAPHQLLLLALFHNRVKEAAEDVETVPGADFTEAGMIRQRLPQIIAYIPAHGSRRSAAWRISWRAARMPSKNITRCSLKNTMGSIEGRPPHAYVSLTRSRTNDRARTRSR